MFFYFLLIFFCVIRLYLERKSLQMLYRRLYKFWFVYVVLYLVLVFLCDKYIFETKLVLDSWSRANQNYGNDPQFHKMFNFVDTSALLK